MPRVQKRKKVITDIQGEQGCGETESPAIWWQCKWQGPLRPLFGNLLKLKMSIPPSSVWKHVHAPWLGEAS